MDEPETPPEPPRPEDPPAPEPAFELPPEPEIEELPPGQTVSPAWYEFPDGPEPDLSPEQDESEPDPPEEDYPTRVVDRNGHYNIPMVGPREHRAALRIVLEMTDIASRLEQAGGIAICRSTADIRAAMETYGIAAPFSAASLALYTQAVLQGAFILAKAKGGAAAAEDCVDHLRRYVELLFNHPKQRRKHHDANAKERGPAGHAQRVAAPRVRRRGGRH